LRKGGVCIAVTRKLQHRPFFRFRHIQ
jgi:hypothetical protein